MPEVDINILAVLVAALINMVIGAVWYSPMVAGKAWMKATGITMKDIEAAKKKGMAASYVMGLVGSLVMAYVLAHIVDFTNSTTVVLGIQAGFWSWLGFVATVSLNHIAWEGKSWSYWVINNGYTLISLMIMGALLAVWV